MCLCKYAHKCLYMVIYNVKLYYITKIILLTTTRSVKTQEAHPMLYFSPIESKYVSK